MHRIEQKRIKKNRRIRLKTTPFARSQRRNLKRKEERRKSR
jgi:hypothetical protein